MLHIQHYACSLCRSVVGTSGDWTDSQRCVGCSRQAVGQIHSTVMAFGSDISRLWVLGFCHCETARYLSRYLLVSH